MKSTSTFNEVTKPVMGILMTGLVLLGIMVPRASAQGSAILTPKPGPAPRINGPAVFGVRPGHPILFTVPASGIRPMEFSAEKLPKGVVINKQTGVISGTITNAGQYPVILHAKNKAGKTSRSFKFIAGETISLTPPMGWNHYNIYGTRITQEQVLEQARAMAASGLINHGWSYMNIDDGWQGKRGGPWNAIQPDTARFRDMQTLCHEVHALGLKIGTYSTPWVESYGHRTGGSAMNPEGLFERTKENIPRNKKQLPYAIGMYSFLDSDVKQYGKPAPGKKVVSIKSIDYSPNIN